MKFITLTALTALAYDNGIVPTVTIMRDGKAVRINETDFDPNTMELAGAPVAALQVEPAPVAPPPPVDQKLIVMKRGRKFFIADMVGQVVEGEAAAALGIAGTGYSTEADAQAVLTYIAQKA